METCSLPQQSVAEHAEQKPETDDDQDRLCQQLNALRDISNARHDQLRLRTGSGRTVTKRAFGLAIPEIAPAEQPQANAQTIEQSPGLNPAQQLPAASSSVQHTPAAHASLAQAQSIKSQKSSFGSAVEGVLERPWRSIGRKSLPSRFAAPGTALRATPMEGVLERFEQPGTSQQRHASTSQQASTPVGFSKCEAVLRLQLSPGDEAELLQKDSPVQGLLEPQSDPALQQPSSCVPQLGNLGFFGSLNTAPILYDTPGRPFSQLCALVQPLQAYTAGCNYSCIFCLHIVLRLLKAETLVDCIARVDPAEEVSQSTEEWWYDCRCSHAE